MMQLPRLTPVALAFAAALTATMGDDHVSGNVLAGIYGAELALVLDAMVATGAIEEDEAEAARAALGQTNP